MARDASRRVLEECTLFDAGDSNDNGIRQWAPIVTKPGIAVLDGSSRQPNIYWYGCG